MRSFLVQGIFISYTSPRYTMHKYVFLPPSYTCTPLTHHSIEENILRGVIMSSSPYAMFIKDPQKMPTLQDLPFYELPRNRQQLIIIFFSGVLKTTIFPQNFFFSLTHQLCLRAPSRDGSSP